MKFQALSLGHRLGIVLAVTLAPMIAVMVLNEVQLRSSREHEVHSLALQRGKLASLEMQRIIDGVEGVLWAVAKAPMVRRLDPESCTRYLVNLKPQLPQLIALSVVSLDGMILCRSEPTTVSRMSNLAFLEEARSAPGFMVGRYSFGGISRKHALPVSVPVLDEGGRRIGFVASALDLGWLDSKLRERDFAQNSALTIADRDGTIIARQPFSERFVGTRIPEAFRHLLVANAPGTQNVISQDGSRRVIGYYPAGSDPKGFYISAGISPDEAFREIDAVTWRTVLITIGSLVAATTGAWLTNRFFVTRPVRHLVSTIQVWRAGQEEARTGLQAGASEFGRVGAAIDAFMDELAERRRAAQRAEALQKLLMGELQHRVKNTLATVQAVAGQTFRADTDARRAELETFSARLKAIGEAHDLLMRDNWQSADMADIVNSTLAPFSHAGAGQITPHGPSLRIRSKAALALAMALHEMATNAVKYGALSTRGGHVEVQWSCGPGPDGTFRFAWKETSENPVAKPARTGFGTRMIQRALAAELDAHVEADYAPGGVRYLIEAPAHRVMEEKT